MSHDGGWCHSRSLPSSSLSLTPRRRSFIARRQATSVLERSRLCYVCRSPAVESAHWVSRFLVCSALCSPVADNCLLACRRHEPDAALHLRPVPCCDARCSVSVGQLLRIGELFVYDLLPFFCSFFVAADICLASLCAACSRMQLKLSLCAQY